MAGTPVTPEGKVVIGGEVTATVAGVSTAANQTAQTAILEEIQDRLPDAGAATEAKQDTALLFIEEMHTLMGGGLPTDLGASGELKVGEGFARAEVVTLGADFSITLGGGQCTALWVGGVGNVKVDMATTGTAIVFTAVPAGTWLKIRVTKVYSTANGTTASNIVAVA